MIWIKKFIRGVAVFATAASFLVLSAICLIDQQVPVHFQTVAGNEFFLDSPGLSVEKIYSDEITAPASSIKGEAYQAQVMFLDTIPVKTVHVNVVEETKVIPCGTPFGIKMFTNGVMIVGIGEIQSEGQIYSPGEDAGLKQGDIIVSIDGEKMEQNEQVAEMMEKSDGRPVKITVKRDETLFETTLTPVKSDVDSLCKGGLWVRDSTAGIGTVTFYEEDTGTFGGLGHGVCDVDTAGIMPLKNGEIVPVTISGVVKGEKGNAGELRGYFNSDIPTGNLLANVETGVYGQLNKCPIESEAIPVAMKQEVKSGPAQIVTTIDESGPQYYDIQIESVNYDESAKTKNLVISVTDSDLLEKTGGIVQGMSGSPIIQNGKLVGAVTHVFVNDPARGYGIFAENMLEVSQSINPVDELAS